MGILDEGRRTQVSRWLAFHLRHRPEHIGLTLDHAGWVDVDALLAAAAESGFRVSGDEVADVVAAGDKRRYEFDGAGRRIRACYGHSVAVELGLASTGPPGVPEVLYHGTVRASVAAIMAEGLMPMGRQHVHLSSDVADADAVGRRRGRPVVLRVRARAMAEAGFELCLATDAVWLCEGVPPEFLHHG